MFKDQIQAYKKEFQKRTEEIKHDSKRASELLIRAGINTRKGNLRKEYRESN